MTCPFTLLMLGICAIYWAFDIGLSSDRNRAVRASISLMLFVFGIGCFGAVITGAA